jgi:hypothetical protein
MEPPIHAVRAADAFIGFVWIASFERPPPAIGYARAIVRM